MRASSGMKRCLVLVPLMIGGLLIGSPSKAGPITFNTALPVAKGQWIFRGQYLLIRASDDPTPMDRSLTVNAAPLVLATGVTPKLALFSVVPFLDKSIEVNAPAGRQTRGASGLGDVMLVARYTVSQWDRPGETIRIAPFGGVKFPTGRHADSDRLGRLPQPLQPGSGSWDGLAGATLTWQRLDWEIDADAGYRRNGEADGFRFGDAAFADVSFQYRLLPRQLGAGVPGYLYAVLESNLVSAGRNRIGGARDPDSGGTTWNVDLGLQYVTARYILEAAVQLPAVQQLHGSALKTDYQVTAGFRVNL